MVYAQRKGAKRHALFTSALSVYVGMGICIFCSLYGGFNAGNKIQATREVLNWIGKV